MIPRPRRLVVTSGHADPGMTYSLTDCLFDEHISYLVCHCVM